MTFDIIVLVCALGQSIVECQPPTAFDQIPLGHVTNELMCGEFGEQRLAQVIGAIPAGYYPKITCLKREDERL